ncbi:MAG: hypothetical protein ACFFG0_15410 [Candidatus Thorarchaeota archaeon]
MAQIQINCTSEEKKWMFEIAKKLSQPLTYTIVKLLEEKSEELNIPLPEDRIPLNHRWKGYGYSRIKWKDHPDARWQGHLRKIEKKEGK